MKIIGKIISALITLAIIAYAGITIYDYLLVRDKKDPKFCYETVERTYDDGKTTEFKCLGYKVYKYERDSLNAYEFGFFIDEKQPE